MKALYASRPYLIYAALACLMVYHLWLGSRAVQTGLPYLVNYDEPFLSTAALNSLKTGRVTPEFVENCYGGFMRYTCVAIDWVYFQFVKNDPRYKVTTIADIKTNQEGHFRTLNVTGFYFWNRMWVMLLGAGCLCWVFLIAKQFTNDYLALLAACLLQINYEFFVHSIYTTVDVPMCFWALATVWAALRFHLSQYLGYLFLSLVFGAMAASTKFTGALVLMVSLQAFLYNLTIFKTYSVSRIIFTLAGLGFTPILVFLAWNPAVYLNYGEFLHWVKWIADAYKTGGVHFSKEPGWEHIFFQWQSFSNSLRFSSRYFNLPIPILSVVGVLIGSFSWDRKQTKPKALLLSLVFVFPAIYFFYMTRQRIAYHRNFILLYPFLCMGFSVFCFTIYQIAEKIRQERFSILPAWGWGGALSLLFISVGVQSLVYGRFFYDLPNKTKDTRTTTLQNLPKLVNSTPEKMRVGIAHELRIAEEDLQDLPYAWQMIPHQALNKLSSQFTHLLVGEYESFEEPFKSTDDSLNKLTLLQRSLLQSTIKGNKVMRDFYRLEPMISPTIHILKGGLADSKIDAVKHQCAGYKIFSVDEVKSFLKVSLAKNQHYELRIAGLGNAVSNQYPSMQVRLDNQIIAQFTLKSLDYQTFYFVAQHDQKDVTLQLAFVKDASDKAPQQDRRAYVQLVTWGEIENPKDSVQWQPIR